MNEPFRIRAAAELENLAAMRRLVEDAAADGACDPEAVSDMVLAMNEAATNIILHGYQGQPGLIEVEVVCNQDALVVRLRDQAPVFDPTRAPSPDVTLSLEQRPLGGMGIYMMRQLTDELRHRTLPGGGNELVLVKRARPGPRGTP
jgi:serine/threonine-protein kinase RsbW